MKIALPVQGEVLDQHFGHCKEFVFVEVSDATRTVMSLERYPAPMHEHGLLPRWLAEHKVQVVIVGGMGAHARQLLVSLGIEVISGAASAGPEQLVAQYLAGVLESVERGCSHGCSHG